MSNGKKLLLVEDDAIIALGEKRILEREGYEVIHAPTGEKAVDIATDKNRHIDLVLMDIDLGAGIDGTEAARRILATCTIPISFLSSHTEKEYTDRAEQITSYGYIVKNSGETVLIASIKMAFRLFEATTNLRRSEQRFRLLAENARDLIYRIELLPERRFSYVSPSAYEITGYTPEEHYEDPDLGMKLVHPSDQDHLRELIQSGSALERPLVLRWCRKDGAVIWTEQNNVPVYDQSGSLVAIEGIARDITERKALEESLRNSNQRLAAFLHVSKEVSVATELGSLLQQIVDSVATVTKLRSNAIYLLCDQSRIRLSAATPPLPDDFPEHLRIADLHDHPHIRAAIETTEPLILEDTVAAELTAAERAVVEARNLRSILYLPVCSQETVLGVIILSSIGNLHTFQEEEIPLLQGFADQVGRLIAQVRKNQEMEPAVLSDGSPASA